jgi:hypothetical protein
MRVLDRRRFVLTSAAGGLALAATTPQPAQAATDDELAYANFGLATELLLQDFYANVTEAKLFMTATQRNMGSGAVSAAAHVTALTQLLTDAGQTAAAAEDFDFAWPDGTFVSKKAAAGAGLTVTQTLLGVYQTAAVEISVPSYRVLYVSMAANLAQQVASLAQILGGRGTGVPFPAGHDLEHASTAVEGLLG